MFFGLYAGCQAWWFLAVCLGVWAFLLVAASFWLTGKQFLFPVGRQQSGTQSGVDSLVRQADADVLCCRCRCCRPLPAACCLPATALVTAFVVATNFSTVQQAFTMTLVKTIAISGAIVVYTTASILLFPQTATQQVRALGRSLGRAHYATALCYCGLLPVNPIL